MKYIDVTLTLESGMRGVKFESARLLKKDGWNAKTLHLYSHAGTHMDAPFHFEVNEGTIDRISIERFITDCYLVDLSEIQPKTDIKISNLGDVQFKLQKGEGLIFRTGWSKWVNSPVYRDGLPGISGELARWCADKGVATIGVEPPSVADVNNPEILTEIHQILLGADIVIVEGLSNLEKISKQKVQLIALPLKIKNGDGSPCRAIVIEE